MSAFVSSTCVCIPVPLSLFPPRFAFLLFSHGSISDLPRPRSAPRLSAPSVLSRVAGARTSRSFRFVLVRVSRSLSRVRAPRPSGWRVWRSCCFASFRTRSWRRPWPRSRSPSRECKSGVSPSRRWLPLSLSLSLSLPLAGPWVGSLPAPLGGRRRGRIRTSPSSPLPPPLLPASPPPSLPRPPRFDRRDPRTGGGSGGVSARVGV